MKNKIYRLIILMLFTVLGMVNAQAQEMVTVKGKILDTETGKPPYVLVAVNEEGVGDYYVLGDRIGSNHHVLMDKHGKFKIKIRKGGSLIINPSYPYKKFEIKDITKNTRVDVVLDIYSKANRPTSLSAEIAKVGAKKHVVKGRITNSITGKSLQNVSISERWIYNERGSNRHTLSDKDGNYSFTIHKGNSINFDGIGYETQVFDNIDSNRTINVSFVKKE